MVLWLMGVGCSPFVEEGIGPETNEGQTGSTSKAAPESELREMAGAKTKTAALDKKSAASESKLSALATDSEPASSFFEICERKLMKQGVNSVDAHNWCGGQVGDSFGYGELNFVGAS